MNKEYIEPKTLNEVLRAIEDVIEQVNSRGDIGKASWRITSLTLANNSLEIEDFYGRFPELLDLTDIAADLEWQAEDYSPEGAAITKEEHDQWVQESWQKLKDAFEATKTRYNDNKPV
jgi:hypothetical protein